MNNAPTSKLIRAVLAGYKKRNWTIDTILRWYQGKRTDNTPQHPRDGESLLIVQSIALCLKRSPTICELLRTKLFTAGMVRRLIELGYLSIEHRPQLNHFFISIEELGMELVQEAIAQGLRCTVERYQGQPVFSEEEKEILRRTLKGESAQKISSDLGLIRQHHIVREVQGEGMEKLGMQRAYFKRLTPTALEVLLSQYNVEIEALISRGPERQAYKMNPSPFKKPY